MKGHAHFDPDCEGLLKPSSSPSGRAIEWDRKLTLETLPTADDPETFDGMPCSVQVATPTYRDEECLYAAKIIDEVLNGDRRV